MMEQFSRKVTRVSDVWFNFNYLQFWIDSYGFFILAKTFSASPRATVPAYLLTAFLIFSNVAYWCYYWWSSAFPRE